MKNSPYLDAPLRSEAEFRATQSDILSESDLARLDAIGDNWMLRNDNDGVSYGGFETAPVGEWNTCPKWGPHTKADCKSGGFFGQGPDGFGFAHDGNRLVFCETRGPRMVVNRNKIKVPEFRVLYTDLDALAAAFYKCSGYWPGSLFLNCLKLTSGIKIGDIGGNLYISNTWMENVAFGDVGGALLFERCIIENGVSFGDVGGAVNLSYAKISASFKIGHVGGPVILLSATMEGCKNSEEIIQTITCK